MKKLLSIALLCAASVAAPLAAHANAVPVNGTAGVGFFTGSSTNGGTTTNLSGGQLDSATTVSWNSSVFSGGSGDFTGIGAFAGSGTITLSSLTSFTLIFPGYGTFSVVPANGTSYYTASNTGGTQSGLTIYLYGQFDPNTPSGTVLAGELTDSALLTLSFSQSGTGITGSASLSSPIPATPEPSSFLLLGTGLIGMAFLMRRRFAL